MIILTTLIAQIPAAISLPIASTDVFFSGYPGYSSFDTESEAAVGHGAVFSQKVRGDAAVLLCAYTGRVFFPPFRYKACRADLSGLRHD